ncbi:MAG TPA: hypothetical protein VF104_02570, partial [Burkholderiales bacterium]
TAAEFTDWQHYAAAEPFGETRADLRAGIIASTVANYAGKMRRDGLPPAVPTDFMPFVDRPAEPEPEAEPDPVAHFEALSHGH